MSCSPICWSRDARPRPPWPIGSAGQLEKQGRGYRGSTDEPHDGQQDEGCPEELSRTKADRRAVVPEGVVQLAVLMARHGEDVDNPERERAAADRYQGNGEATTQRVADGGERPLGLQSGTWRRSPQGPPVMCPRQRPSQVSHRGDRLASLLSRRPRSRAPSGEIGRLDMNDGMVRSIAGARSRRFRVLQPQAGGATRSPGAMVPTLPKDNMVHHLQPPGYSRWVAECLASPLPAPRGSGGAQAVFQDRGPPPNGGNRARSGCGDLNPGPPAPKAGALPSCATSRGCSAQA